MGAHLIQSDPPCSPSGEESEARLKLEGLFNRLYDELRVRVSLYLRRIGLSPEDAEEIVQETFFRLFRRLLGNGWEENLRGWVYRVAHNLAVDRLNVRRRLEPRSLREFAALGDLLCDQASSPERSLIEQEELALIERAIRSLPPRQRQCLRLRLEGFGHREIAEILGMETAAVSQSLHRAIRKLRADTHPAGPGER